MNRADETVAALLRRDPVPELSDAAWGRMFGRTARSRARIVRFRVYTAAVIVGFTAWAIPAVLQPDIIAIAPPEALPAIDGPEIRSEIETAIEISQSSLTPSTAAASNDTVSTNPPPEPGMSAESNRASASLESSHSWSRTVSIRLDGRVDVVLYRDGAETRCSAASRDEFRRRFPDLAHVLDEPPHAANATEVNASSGIPTPVLALRLGLVLASHSGNSAGFARGIEIADVIPGRAMTLRGIRAGDRITAIGASEIHEDSDLSGALHLLYRDPTLEISIMRGGESIVVPRSSKESKGVSL